MLNQNEIIKKIYEQPEVFNQLFREKKYPQALHCVDACRIVCLFSELDEIHLMELFGGTPYGHEEIEGLFDEMKVLSAMEWCIKNNQTRQDMTLKDKEERERAWKNDCKGISETIKRC